MRLTKNFTQREFRCKEDVTEVADNLQILRDFLGERVRVIGYNHSSSSVDIKSPAIDNEDLYLIMLSLIETKDLKKGKLELNNKFVTYEIN